MAITKDSIIGDVLDQHPETAQLFLSIGMHCLGCPASRGETIEEACYVGFARHLSAKAHGSLTSAQTTLIFPCGCAVTAFAPLRSLPTSTPHRCSAVK